MEFHLQAEKLIAAEFRLKAERQTITRRLRHQPLCGGRATRPQTARSAVASARQRRRASGRAPPAARLLRLDNQAPAASNDSLLARLPQRSARWGNYRRR